MLLTKNHRRVTASFQDRNLPKRIRSAADDFRKIGDRQLQDVAEAIREQRSTHNADAVCLGLAISMEALRRTLNVNLFDHQLAAAQALTSGMVVEMATGEGKTLAAAPAAMVGAIQGNAVHVATPNAYLAYRDHAQVSPAFELLGISCSLLPERSPPRDKQTAYNCDVTYGTGYEFGFDYLRDQFSVRSQQHSPLGEALLTTLGRGIKPRTTLQRGRMMSIVDEVDNVLIDDAGSPLILSDASSSLATDTDACILASITAVQMREREHFCMISDGCFELTVAGREIVHDAKLGIPVKQLRRPWDEYIHQALRAHLLFQRDAHYVVDQDTIRIVDGSTGRVFSERTWSEGLHQAIEAKEGLPISRERAALAQITRQRYYRLYASLSGMTGTAVGCETEFATLYGMRTKRILPRLPCQRTIFPMRSFASSESKWQSMAAEVHSHHRRGRPVLVGTNTIADSESLADILRARGLDCQLLNGRQDAAEAAVIAHAGRAGAVTIATNLAGRGTDIRLDASARQCGGLHVIVAEPHALSRVDRQLVGRCARQGDPGSATLFLSAEDHFVERFGPWLARPIRKSANSSGEVRVDLTTRVCRIQQTIERRQAAARKALMHRDMARESLLIESRCQ